MPRYVAMRPYWASDLEDDILSPEGLTVYENEREPVDTGLVDAQGTPVYRMPDVFAMGFQMPSERPMAGKKKGKGGRRC